MASRDWNDLKERFRRSWDSAVQEVVDIVSVIEADDCEARRADDGGTL